MNKYWVCYLLAGCGLGLPAISAGEVLMQMSDETAPAVSEAVSTEGDDRRIVYRVICSPEGDALPDCGQAVTDRESSSLQSTEQAPEQAVAGGSANDETPGENLPAEVVGKAEEPKAAVSGKKAVKKAKNNKKAKINKKKPAAKKAKPTKAKPKK